MRFFSRVFLPFLLLIYIGIETYLKLNHTSLCGEVGCKLAGELLNFDAIYLNYFGLAGVFMLIVLGLLSLKNKFYEALFFIGLYTAIAFEATIISYQFVANPEPCIFCLGIFSSLLAIALLSQWKHFAITLVTVLAIFVGLNTLAVTKNKSFITASGNYLVQSSTCPHCKKVKAYLADNNITYIPISTKEASARNFLKFAGITSIPVLIVKKPKNILIITGDKKIISHFEASKIPNVVEKEPKPSPSQSSSVELSTGGFDAGFLSEGGDDAGCAITIAETANCADSNTTH